MRFLLDEDLSPAVAEVARGSGLDVLSVHEIDRRGFDDATQLRLAARDERIFVTRNRDDFLTLTLQFFQAGSAHAGVLIVPYSLPNNRPERIARALKRWHDQQARFGEPGPYVIDFLPSQEDQG
jgi:predicted nuclease of predicted toxin-antitoxin system